MRRCSASRRDARTVNVTSQIIDLPQLRLRLFTPVSVTPKRWPGVLAYSDIFQQTPPHVRICTRLAAQGFAVLAPELYGRVEPPGVVLDFEADRQRAMDDAAKIPLPWFDADLMTALAFAASHPFIDPERLLACGWCIGGHLAFRAALDPRIKATVCCYPTGLHTDSVGAANGTAKSLDEARRITGDLLLLWGSRDPHIPLAGRHLIHRRLAEMGVAFQTRTFDAEHTFMRDEGPRWEPAAADEEFSNLLSVFTRWR